MTAHEDWTKAARPRDCRASRLRSGSMTRRFRWLRRRRFKDWMEEGLRLVLEPPRKARRNPSLAELMKPAQGVIDSGIPDLASNPEHLKGFGRDAGHR